MCCFEVVAVVLLRLFVSPWSRSWRLTGVVVAASRGSLPARSRDTVPPSIVSFISSLSSSGASSCPILTSIIPHVRRIMEIGIDSVFPPSSKLFKSSSIILFPSVSPHPFLIHYVLIFIPSVFEKLPFLIGAHLIQQIIS